MRRGIRSSLAVVCALGLGGCGMNAMSSGAEFGATQGGVQDMSFARELVANGQVPPPEAFVVEGMFSEHDLPLSGAACPRLLCLRGALGIAPALDEKRSGWVQVGMSSKIDPAAFQRADLGLVAVVDVSGSMGWDYSRGQNSYPTPGELSRMLLRSLAAELRAGDRFAIVTYGSDVHVALAPTAGSDQSRISGAIDGLSEDGSTNMEAGLEKGFAVAEGMPLPRRVILFTDAQPNVGATASGRFQQMAEQAAADGIGLTVFGLGLGLGQELINAMSHLRGGNAFSFTKREQVAQHMEENWPWFVSPIAYDLALELVPSQGFAVADAYGFPKADGAPGASLNVATVFLSKKKGALLVRLALPEQGPAGLAAEGTLRYTTPEGSMVEEPLHLAYGGEALDERGHFYQQPSVRKAVALAILVAAMREASEAYPTDAAAALAKVQSAAERFAADCAAIADPGMQPEIDLVNALAALMEKGAPQGNLYGQR